MSTTELAAGYDYVSVGGGSAGCVLAARLAEASPEASVLLIEAGPDGRGVAQIADPPQWTKLLEPRWTGGTGMPVVGGSGPGHRDLPREGPGRLQRDQRYAVVPRPPGGL